MAPQAVPGPLARPGARFGTAQEAQRAVPARPHRAVPGTGPCRAGPVHRPSIAGALVHLVTELVLVRRASTWHGRFGSSSKYTKHV